MFSEMPESIDADGAKKKEMVNNTISSRNK